MLTVGSLFSGIGGIDLGLERAGMRVIWQAETDPYASRVLAKHWPMVPNLGDVKLIDWSGVERPDIVCGGFPCQPVSLAGRGLAQRDERWLWPEFVRCIRSLRPGHVLVENVPGLLVRGMGDVLGDLAASGYDAEWTGIPAAAVGAPHIRFRVFVVARDRDRVAYPVGAGPHRAGQPQAVLGGNVGAAEDVDASQLGDGCSDVADADGSGPQGHGGEHELRGVGEEVPPRRCGVGDSDPQRWDGRARVFGQGRGGQPAHSGWWESEPELGRVAHGIPHRVDRLRCLGNAVVPQVAEWLGRRLLELDDLDGVDQSGVGENGTHLLADSVQRGVLVGGEHRDIEVQVDKNGDLVSVHASDGDGRPQEVKRQALHIDGTQR